MNFKELLSKYNFKVVKNVYNGEFYIVDLYKGKSYTFDKQNKFMENINFKLELLEEESINFKPNEIFSELIKVNEINYLPTRELFFIQDSSKILNINFPKKNTYHLLDNQDPLQYLDKFPLLLKVISNLFEDDKEAINWGFNWFANIIQYNMGKVSNKAHTSMLFYGIQGSGKNFLFNGVLNMFLKTKELDQRDLESPNNGYLIENNLIIFNEIEVKKNNHIMDRIKNMITCNEHIINIKHIQQYPIKNIHNYAFTSNKPIPLIIEDGDRRFSIFKPKKTILDVITLEQISEFDKCFKNNKPSQAYMDELISLGNYLYNFDIDYDLISKPLLNETKKRLTSKALTLNSKFVSELKNKDLKEFCEENDLDYTKYLVGHKNEYYYTQKKKIYQLYEDYFKIMSNKEEYIKRKDQILDDLEDVKIFTSLGRQRIRIKELDVQGTESYGYLYRYNKRSTLYPEHEVEIPEMVDLT